jgi:hypothetical protein
MVEKDQDHLGLTDEQWTIFQRAPQGFGEQDKNGVDISLLRENLKLTPTQRLQKLESARAFFAGMKNGQIRRIS